MARLYARLPFFLCTPILACTVLLADTTTYTYDSAGRLTQVVYPNGKTISYTYDNAGNVLSRQVSAPSGQIAKEKPAARKDNKQGVKHAQ